MSQISTFDFQILLFMRNALKTMLNEFMFQFSEAFNLSLLVFIFRNLYKYVITPVRIFSFDAIGLILYCRYKITDTSASMFLFYNPMNRTLRTVVQNTINYIYRWALIAFSKKIKIDWEPILYNEKLQKIGAWNPIALDVPTNELINH